MANKNPFQGDDVDPFSGVRGADGGIKREAPKPAAKPAPAAKKAPVVTKEQLEKSGFTSLRDYMNAQKGLTRRDGKAPVMRTAAPAAPAAKTAAPRAASPVRAEMQRNTASNAAANRQRLEEQRKAREARASQERRSLFGRNPRGKTPDEALRHTKSR